MALSVCSVAYSFLAMIQLLHQVPPPSTTHPATFVQDHLDELLHVAMSKPTEVLGDRIVLHTKVPYDLMIDSWNPRHGGCRRISSDIFSTARSFDTHIKATRVASTHCRLPSEMAQCTGRTTCEIVATSISSRSRTQELCGSE